MLIAAIILGTLALLFGILFASGLVTDGRDERRAWPLVMCVGYTTGHLRFSQNAGLDTQPSFCAKADSPVAKQITELAGSGKKVRVTVPPYFYFSNNPFACGTTEMTIKEL